MSLTPRLILRQSQSLVMTPQLMQAIKLLQLSSLDLAVYVAEELERNPLLERAPEEDAREGESDRDDGGEETPAASDGPVEGDWLQPSLSESRADIEDRLDTDLGNLYPDEQPSAGETYAASDWALGGGGGQAGEGDFSFDSVLRDEISLADHLEAQLQLATEDPRERIIGGALIGAIDDAGYLSESVESVAERIGTTPTEVEKVLAIVQGFDPAGVGARDLAECLAIQLRERDRFDPAMQCLVANLELVARRDLAALRRVCGVDEEDIADMLHELRALTPKPGLGFGGGNVQTVIPDVIVRQAPDGTWALELNPETLPRLLVNQAYQARVSGRSANAQEKAFVTECLQTANWLVRSLEQRARTILKVSAEIVRQQDAFLTRGVEYLRPLNLRAVAEATGLHESTISRVTANKYMATPRGIFEMKYFFTAAIAATVGGEAHSAEAVRHRIRQMIEAEAPSAILSDDTIVQNLRDGGIDIARRTVAKYREGMGIPSSVQRRREKMAPA